MIIERGRFEAFGVAPLSKMSVEPDIVQIWGTPPRSSHWFMPTFGMEAIT